MRRLKRGGIALAVLLGLAMPVLAADQDAPASSNWWGSWFGGKDKPAEKKPQLQKDDQPAVPIPAAGDSAATVFTREWDAYFRRIAVCDRLESYALQAGDNEAVRRVQQLKERVDVLYKERTANLSGKPATSAIDEAALQQNLGTRSSPTNLLPQGGTPGELRATYMGGNK
jgi:hypothetical protein